MNREERRAWKKTHKGEELPVLTDLQIKTQEALMIDRIAKAAVAEASRNNFEDAWNAAAAKAYADWMHHFEYEFLTAMIICASMALKEKFPSWGEAPVKKFRESMMAWSDKFVREYKNDTEAFRNLYAITFGKPLEFDITELDGKTIVSGKGIPRHDR